MIFNLRSVIFAIALSKSVNSFAAGFFDDFSVPQSAQSIQMSVGFGPVITDHWVPGIDRTIIGLASAGAKVTVAIKNGEFSLDSGPRGDGAAYLIYQFLEPADFSQTPNLDLTLLSSNLDGYVQVRALDKFGKQKITATDLWRTSEPSHIFLNEVFAGLDSTNIDHLEFLFDYLNLTCRVDSIQAVPEPTPFVTLAIGGVVAFVRKRFRTKRRFASRSA